MNVGDSNQPSGQRGPTVIISTIVVLVGLVLFASTMYRNRTTSAAPQPSTSTVDQQCSPQSPAAGTATATSTDKPSNRVSAMPAQQPPSSPPARTSARSGSA